MSLEDIIEKKLKENLYLRLKDLVDGLNLNECAVRKALSDLEQQNKIIRVDLESSYATSIRKVYCLPPHFFVHTENVYKLVEHILKNTKGLRSVLRRNLPYPIKLALYDLYYSKYAHNSITAKVYRIIKGSDGMTINEIRSQINPSCLVSFLKTLQENGLIAYENGKYYACVNLPRPGFLNRNKL